MSIEAKYYQGPTSDLLLRQNEDYSFDSYHQGRGWSKISTASGFSMVVESTEISQEDALERIQAIEARALPVEPQEIVSVKPFLPVLYKPAMPPMTIPRVPTTTAAATLARFALSTLRRFPK